MNPSVEVYEMGSSRRRKNPDRARCVSSARIQGAGTAAGVDSSKVPQRRDRAEDACLATGVGCSAAF